MSDDDFEDEPTLDEEDLDEDVLEEDFVEEDEVLDDDVADEIDAEIIDVVAVPGILVAPAEPVEEDEEDDVVDLDEELHPDDVEEALDVVLRERTVAAGLEEDEEDDEEPDERGEPGGTKIVPRRENEFLCKSCFLVLPRHQLADEKRMICRDCA
jgi:hypothetical protein